MTLSMIEMDSIQIAFRMSYGVIPSSRMLPLFLRTIDSLVDEEYSKILEILNKDLTKDLFDENDLDKLIFNFKSPSNEENFISSEKWIEIIDYFRSIKILIRFRNYTVEEILKLKWCVIGEEDVEEIECTGSNSQIES